MCNSAAGLTSVLIIVDPTLSPPNQISPKDCYVKKGTQMIWREQHNTPFRLEFVEAPGNGTQKIFPSTENHGVQEVPITARNVNARKWRNYEVYVGTTRLDPAVIIDP